MSPEACEVVELARTGDEAAFTELHRLHALPVYNLALRVLGEPDDAEDVCQETWLKVHRELCHLRAAEAFPTWLRRIVTRKCLDAIRRRRQAVPLEDDVEAGNSSSPQGRAAQREALVLTWEALGSLTPKQGIALFLREVEGYDYRRIAATVETSVSGVETLLFRARRALAQSYDALESSRSQRCRQAQSLMAAVLDAEGGSIRRRSLLAHLDVCPACREQMRAMRRVSAAYGVLPLLAAPGLKLVSISAGGAGASAVGLGKLLLMVARAKSLLAPVAVATTISAGALVLPTVMTSTPELPGNTKAVAAPDKPQDSQTSTDANAATVLPSRTSLESTNSTAEAQVGIAATDMSLSGADSKGAARQELPPTSRPLSIGAAGHAEAAPDSAAMQPAGNQVVVAAGPTVLPSQPGPALPTLGLLPLGLPPVTLDPSSLAGEVQDTVTALIEVVDEKVSTIAAAITGFLDSTSVSSLSGTNLRVGEAPVARVEAALGAAEGTKPARNPTSRIPTASPSAAPQVNSAAPAPETVTGVAEAGEAVGETASDVVGTVEDVGGSVSGTVSTVIDLLLP